MRNAGGEFTLATGILFGMTLLEELPAKRG
ncbi:hypothetical protein KIPE111705_42755 [Kibdelosporangium persicum]